MGKINGTNNTHKTYSSDLWAHNSDSIYTSMWKASKRETHRENEKYVSIYTLITNVTLDLYFSCRYVFNEYDCVSIPTENI